MVREQSALCVGPQRRKPYRQLKKPPLCQLPVRSGCPSARRGVVWFCADWRWRRWRPEGRGRWKRPRGRSRHCHRDRLLDARRHRHHDIHAAGFRFLRRDIANDRAVPTLGQFAGVQHLDFVEGIVPVLVVAVGELGRGRSVLHHDALGHVLGIERGCCGRAGNARDRERDDRLPAFPRDGRLPRHRHTVLQQRGRIGAPFGPFVDAEGRRLRRALRARPQSDQPLLHRRRHRRRFTLTGNDFGARDVFVPRVLAAHDLDVRVRLSVRASARVLNALAGRLIVDAGAILRQRAGLAVDLDAAAVRLILERDHQLVLVDAPQHARVPGPVEEHGPQIFRVLRRRVRWLLVAAELRPRTRRQQPADGEDDAKRDCVSRDDLCPNHRTTSLADCNSGAAFRRAPLTTL